MGYKLTNPDKNRYASNVLRWKDFIAAGKGHIPAATPYDPQHACVVVHTGGTTGSPKGVMISGKSLSNNVENALHILPVEPGQRVVSMLPLA